MKTTQLAVTAKHPLRGRKYVDDIAVDFDADDNYYDDDDDGGDDDDNPIGSWCKTALRGGQTEESLY